jgi:hypothetical protein
MLYSMCAVFGDVYVSESPYLSVFFEKMLFFTITVPCVFVKYYISVNQ